MKSLLVLAFSLTSAGLLGFSSPALADDDPALAAIDAFIAEAKVDKTSSNWKTHLSKPPQVEFAKDKSYFWLLETDAGLLRFKLMPEVAPMHASSTIYLTRLGFYDDTFFHRVIKGFMAQGGDPLGNGRGGPGYQYAGEFSKDARHDRPGLLSMANAGPGTDGSQFFITFGPTPHLNDKHTVFGALSGSKSALEKLEAVATRSGKPTERITIKKATISVP